MQGTGNDFILIDCFHQQVADPPRLARTMCAQHFGVGADGLILVSPSAAADLRMRIFNSDGTEAEMCGNGIRCLAKYAYENKLCEKEEVRVETMAGLRTVKLVLEGEAPAQVKAATVDMGTPGLKRAEIPMAGNPDARALRERLRIGDHSLEITCLSMGNPHCLIPTPNIDLLPWRELAPRIETHPLFPHRTNVHFVEVVSADEIMLTSWERGVGPTLACGTGAAAACVAMNLLRKTARKITVRLPGGDLFLEWAKDNHVYLTGPAEEVFTGEWKL